MTHPRMIIREATAKALAETESINSAVGGRIYVSRTNPISSDDGLPCINVLTKSERTLEKIHDLVLRQELDVIVEVYHLRKPDMRNPYNKIDGLKNLPSTTQNTDRLLDDLCFSIEEVLFKNYILSKIRYKDGEEIKCLSIEDVTAMSTELNFDDSGSVPFGIAEVKFTLEYQREPNTDEEFCVFDDFYVDFKHKTCTDDPLDGATAISTRANNFSELD